MRDQKLSISCFCSQPHGLKRMASRQKYNHKMITVWIFQFNQIACIMGFFVYTERLECRWWLLGTTMSTSYERGKSQGRALSVKTASSHFRTIRSLSLRRFSASFFMNFGMGQLSRTVSAKDRWNTISQIAPRWQGCFSDIFLYLSDSRNHTMR